MVLCGASGGAVSTAVKSLLYILLTIRECIADLDSQSGCLHVEITPRSFKKLLALEDKVTST